MPSSDAKTPSPVRKMGSFCTNPSPEMRPPLYKGQNVIPKMAFIERFHCNSLCMELIRPAQITAATSFQPSCIHGAGMFHCCKHVNLRQISNPLQITSLLASHAHLCYYRDHSVQRSRVCVCRVIFPHTELTVGKYCFCPTMLLIALNKLKIKWQYQTVTSEPKRPERRWPHHFLEQDQVKVIITSRTHCN